MVFLLFLLPIIYATAFSCLTALPLQPAEAVIAEGTREEPYAGGKKRACAVVFIHGTVLPFISPASFFNALGRVLWDSKAQRSFYDEYLYSLRKHSMYRLQPLGEYGLCEVTPEAELMSVPAQRLGWFYLQWAELLEQSCYAETKIYTFGWPGKLDLDHRSEHARDLLDALNTLAQQAAEDDLALDVVIFAHSHGGNVALHMADFCGDVQPRFAVKELVLFGTPVLIESEVCARNFLFENIYHLCSFADSVQISDIFSSKLGYANRFFGLHPGFEQTPAHIKQVSVSFDGRAPFHTELWFFAHEGGLIFYREYLAIYPFPAAVFAPAILAAVREAPSLLARTRLHSVDLASRGWDFSMRIGLHETFEKKGVPFEQYQRTLNFSQLAQRCGVILTE